ncbi:sensor histidine kinase [Methylobrevis albus]|uniref:histidine kinase n=1 Tax=Methylobrevis albus TaxID=2793297 RepID=A0A931I1Z1_9HYPH|nr:ATP-binding protein [Methylobrevis albus]MBH0237781.1 sensor histidine kinase [Methylobrevis albus]
MSKTSTGPLFAGPLRRSGGRRRLALVAVIAVTIGGLAALAGWIAADGARAGVADRAGTAALQSTELLRAELDKQRAVAGVLAADPEFAAAVAAPGRPPQPRLDRRLAAIAAASRASVIYLLDADGVTIAASNAGRPDSFVGSDYRFRPYFRDAVASGAAEHYALGTVSRRPGLYIGRRVETGGRPGVLVVKVEFDGVEAAWRLGGDTIYVTDPRGIVLATSVPDWRFRATRPIGPDEAAAIRDSLQFGDASLTPLPVAAVDGTGDALPAAGSAATRVQASLPDRRPVEFMAARVPVNGTGWQLTLLAPTGAPVAAARRQAQAGTVAALLLLCVGGASLVRRRSRALERAAAAANAQALLEERVAARTQELSAANARLEAESAERRRAEAKLQEVSDRFLQANRLAILGQIAAGVAHEVNQPVAAIRSFAGNAATLLQRGDTAAVAENLGFVGELADRIGTITEGLRGFAAKGSGDIGPTSVADAADGALLLISPKLGSGRVELQRSGFEAPVQARANRQRLEQVLVNLLRNAIEAIESRAATNSDTPAGIVQLRLDAAAAEVRLTVADNGPGIPEAVMATLFTPFSTTKPRGLGLGLVICNDIVTSFGGRLAVESSPAGTTAVIHLQRTP